MLGADLRDHVIGHFKRARDTQVAATHRDQQRALDAGLVHAFQILRDRHAAEDVQQQVYTEVWRRAGEYDPERAGLLTWTMTITRSRAIDHLRRRIPEPRDPDVAARTIEAGQDTVTESDALADRWRMAHHLGRLPEEERALLRMRFYEELSQTEIAERTGLAVGTVKTRMVRGLRRLRDLIEAEEEEVSS